MNNHILLAKMQLAAFIGIELQYMRERDELGSVNCEDTPAAMAEMATTWALELYEQMSDPKYMHWHIYEIINNFINEKSNL